MAQPDRCDNEGRSIALRRCSHFAASEHSAAHVAPTTQPARTSLGQCTPKNNARYTHQQGEADSCADQVKLDMAVSLASGQ